MQWKTSHANVYDEEKEHERKKAVYVVHVVFIARLCP